MLLGLLPAACFFSFLFNLWAVTLSLVLSVPFILGKRALPKTAPYLFILILISAVVSGITKFQFNSMSFVLQEMLYLIFFILGFNLRIKSRRLLIPLSAFLFIPFVYAAGSINPNIVSSFTALLVALLWLSGAQKGLKYIFSFLGVFLIISHGSYIALFALFAAWVIAAKRRLWPLIIIFISAATFLNENSVIERIIWFKKGFDVFLIAPFGTGFFGMKYFLAGTGTQNTVFLHSFFLQFLIECGIFGFAVLAVFFLKLLKSAEGVNYRFAVLTGIILGLLDYSFYYPACGMLFALIAGLAARSREKNGDVSGFFVAKTDFKIVLFRALFFMSLALAAVMFLSSRNFAKGNFELFSNRPREAVKQYDKVFRFPRYPAVFSARAAALSIIYDEDGSVSLDECFALQEKALAVKGPAYADFLAAKQKKDTGKLRDSCMKVLFLEGAKP
ncbi:MAG: hypothetical protein ABIJ15_05785 [bacterium]